MKRPNGFTLIELVVVMALAAIMLFVAIPRFQDNHTNNFRKTAQWLLVKIPQLKAQAADRKKRLALQFDLNENTMWISHSDMTDEERQTAQENSTQLSEEISIQDVTFPQKGRITSGLATIFFYEGGYSDKAIIHLEDEDDNVYSFVIEPFINRVQMTEADLDFEQ